MTNLGRHKDHVNRMGEDRWNKMPYDLQGESLRGRRKEMLERGF
jgi:hypothetical protein